LKKRNELTLIADKAISEREDNKKYFDELKKISNSKATDEITRNAAKAEDGRAALFWSYINGLLPKPLPTGTN
jgi:hypothetical protein